MNTSHITNNLARVVAQMAFLLTTTVALALPAKRGQWRTLKLADGTTTTAMLVGDEWSHHYVAKDGTVYVEGATDGVFERADGANPSATAAAKRASANARRMARKATVGPATRATLTGERKGLIILVNFSDKSFSTAESTWESALNDENYSVSPFKGSVHDYFLKQSLGLFDITFDVAGPFALSNKVSYYGANDKSGSDTRPATMVAEACRLANSSVDFGDYDWDGDGEVDQVVVIYAGQGEADGGAASTIWPHEWDLASARMYGDGSGALMLDGVKINTYACSPELNGSKKINGIGSLCHEFSHCLGLPDMYDTDYVNFGMGYWDIMDTGTYCGNGYCPAGYTSYERMEAGWATPTDITGEASVTAMKSLQESGESYIIYNKANKNEYYLLENRQNDGWDASLYGRGLLILHVYYDEQSWQDNTVNNGSTQHCTIFHADNEDGLSYIEQLEGDPYPYAGSSANDELTKTSSPAATLYVANDDGTNYMHVWIKDITQNDDGSISFNTGLYDDDDSSGSEVTTVHEWHFDECTGTGGNDGQWSGSIASGSCVLDGWTVLSNASYAGDGCVRFGKIGTSGIATTPEFEVNDSVRVTFRAGVWNATSEDKVLWYEVTSGFTLSKNYDTLDKGAFGDHELTIYGNGKAALTFSLYRRWFLDDLVIAPFSSTNGIGRVGVDALPARKSPTGVYNMQGQRVGDSLGSLPHGIYVVDGRKVVK